MNDISCESGPMSGLLLPEPPPAPSERGNVLVERRLALAWVWPGQRAIEEGVSAYGAARSPHA